MSMSMSESDAAMVVSGEIRRAKENGDIERAQMIRHMINVERLSFVVIAERLRQIA